MGKKRKQKVHECKTLLSSRRQFVKASACMGLGLVAGSLSWLQEGQGQAGISRVIDEVKSRWGLTGGSLKVLYPKGSYGNLKPVVERFYKETGVKVDLLEASLDEISIQMLLDQSLKTNNNLFDVALPPTFALPDLVEAGVIQDLTPFEKRYKVLAQWAEQSLYSLGDHYQGKLYGYQTDGDAYVMFYNKKWLADPTRQKQYSDRFGQPLQAPKTWPELKKQLKFFHRPDKNEFGGSLFRNKNYTVWEYWVRLHAKGIYPVNDEMLPQIDSPLGVLALEELIEDSLYLEPGVKENGLHDNFKSFARGNKYCNIGWGGTQKYLNGPHSQLKDQLAFSPLLGEELHGKKVYMPFFNWGWNYVVSSKTQKSELAYLFCLFAVSPEASTLAIRESEGFFDPFQAAHYEDKKIQEAYGNEFLDVHRLSMNNSIPDFYLRGQGQYLGALKQAIFAANERQVSPQRALRAVVKKWNEITKNLGRENQIKQWKFLKKSYPSSIKEALKS